MVAEESSGGGYEFFLYLFIVHPGCQWILKPGRFPKRTALLYAIAFLGLVSSFGLYFDYFQNKETNYYAVLGAPRSDSTKASIKKSYREVRLIPRSCIRHCGRWAVSCVGVVIDSSQCRRRTWPTKAGHGSRPLGTKTFGGSSGLRVCLCLPAGVSLYAYLHCGAVVVSEPFTITC